MLLCYCIKKLYLDTFNNEHQSKEINNCLDFPFKVADNDVLTYLINASTHTQILYFYDAMFYFSKI